MAQSARFGIVRSLVRVQSPRQIALIVQGTEQRFPKPPIQVRLLVRAQTPMADFGQAVVFSVFKAGSTQFRRRERNEVKLPPSAGSVASSGLLVRAQIDQL